MANRRNWSTGKRLMYGGGMAMSQIAQQQLAKLVGEDAQKNGEAAIPAVGGALPQPPMPPALTMESPDSGIDPEMMAMLQRLLSGSRGLDG